MKRITKMFIENSPVWAKSIIAFNLMLIPLLIEYNFGIEALNKYKNDIVVFLSIISFFLKFTVKDKNN